MAPSLTSGTRPFLASFIAKLRGKLGSHSRSTPLLDVPRYLHPNNNKSKHGTFGSGILSLVLIWLPPGYCFVRSSGSVITQVCHRWDGREAS